MSEPNWYYRERDPDSDGWRVISATGTGRESGAHIMARCDRGEDAELIVHALRDRLKLDDEVEQERPEEEQ